MKNLYFIGGTMGVGKSTVGQELKKRLDSCVFLDGDWCWDASPFVVTQETKDMVMENIAYLLNQFLQCSAYQNVVFCWVLHEQKIVDDLLERLDTSACEVKVISLMCGEETLRKRLEGDVEKGLRESDIIARSIARLPLYEQVDSVKLDTEGKTVGAVVEELLEL